MSGELFINHEPVFDPGELDVFAQVQEQPEICNIELIDFYEFGLNIDIQDQSVFYICNSASTALTGNVDSFFGQNTTEIQIQGMSEGDTVPLQFRTNLITDDLGNIYLDKDNLGFYYSDHGIEKYISTDELYSKFGGTLVDPNSVEDYVDNAIGQSTPVPGEVFQVNPGGSGGYTGGSSEDEGWFSKYPESIFAMPFVCFGGYIFLFYVLPEILKSGWGALRNNIN